MPLFQVALDLWDREKAKDLACRLSPFVDIVEVGTPLLLAFGLSVVEEIRTVLREKLLFVDAKIVDAGREEAEAVFKRGGDVVSVLWGASFPTLRGVREVAEKYGKKWMVDTVDLFPGGEKRIDLVAELQPDFVGLHLSHDVASQEKSSWSFVDFSPFLERSLPLALAGGITLEVLPRLLRELCPQVVVVGSAITSSPHPEEEAEAFRRVLHGFSGESLSGS
ncbi:MAG: orotidine 5'-phosphate decarboxylase / HUMPS family protein [Candidatus Caldatribacteriaceae bacterium]